ncbi:SAM-dependent methyltransferase, partial [Aquitalea magnusonii]|uniref:SAM-dependent methyltransferase n=1 Tax=Aquitalea magnusonii TaxID=332411 RepID=UPI000B272215
MRLLTPAGHALWFGQPQHSEHAELHIHDWAGCRKLLTAATSALPKPIATGCWTARMTALLRLALRNEHAVPPALSGSLPARWWYRLKHLLRRNSRRGSRRNIHAHYDLGNDFYRLWLDPSWTYSSAWFNGNYAQSLQQAQQAKYQRICDTLGLQPGMRVLEIGCGWGGFAEHATRAGIAVHGITISPAQLELARQRLAGQPLAQLELRDYRDRGSRRNIHAHYDLGNDFYRLWLDPSWTYSSAW